MKPYKILLFIICTIAALGLLCSFFPREGVTIGPVSLEFPSIADIMGAPEEPSESPEELIERRMEAIENAPRNEYLEYFRTDPARIYFPDDNFYMFDSLFAAFDNASEEPVKIVHYGDSQIEVDRVSFNLRENLQERFGGIGPGIMPFRGDYFSYSARESATLEPVRYMAYGNSKSKPGTRAYGPMCQMSRLDTSAYVTISSIDRNESASRYFSTLSILAGRISGTLRASCLGVSKSVTAADMEDGMAKITFELPDSTSKVSFSLSGHADIYGIQLEGPGGISVDNVAMRGCSGTIFTKVAADQLRKYYSDNNVRLIILQYGGNVMPYMNTSKGISQYKTSIMKQIAYMKSLAPDADFLFIGPSDMSTNISGKMQTYPHLPEVVDSLRAAAVESGIAFWDMFGAMGGTNSMVKWVKNQPQLAGGDYVHFTKKGADEMGNMLSKALLLYYEYYKLRADERKELKYYTDSLSNVPVLTSRAK